MLHFINSKKDIKEFINSGAYSNIFIGVGSLSKTGEIREVTSGAINFKTIDGDNILIFKSHNNHMLRIDNKFRATYAMNHPLPITEEDLIDYLYSIKDSVNQFLLDLHKERG